MGCVKRINDYTCIMALGYLWNSYWDDLDCINSIHINPSIRMYVWCSSFHNPHETLRMTNEYRFAKMLNKRWKKNKCGMDIWEAVDIELQWFAWSHLLSKSRNFHSIVSTFSMNVTFFSMWGGDLKKSEHFIRFVTCMYTMHIFAGAHDFLWTFFHLVRTTNLQEMFIDRSALA